MTPEERGRKIIYEREASFLPGELVRGNIEHAIAAAIRAAVEEEREACLAQVDAISLIIAEAAVGLPGRLHSGEGGQLACKQISERIRARDE